MNTINLSAAPFRLSAQDAAWVESTLAAMGTEEKIGQLFCLTGMAGADVLCGMIQKYQPGAFMYRAGDGAEIQDANRALQGASAVPLLLAANLESGGNGVATQGTYYAKQLQVAATDDTEMARRLGHICGAEGGAVGCNWAFAPIVDIDMNWRNPITNVRTYGSDPQRVLDMAAAYMDGVAQSGTDMAVCVKHFPGDGVDERDQHLLPSVNSLPAEEWEATFGRVYRSLIDKGAQTLMVGHILQPALTRKLCPGIADADILPCSVNKHLVTGLLRQEMGFNGLITTDATPMVGYTAMLPRRQALQMTLMAGVDMILFCKNADEDFAAIRDGLADGSVSMQRVDEAVTRILATKAALGLHQKRQNGTLVPGSQALEALGCPQHRAWAANCADAAVTLVRDNQRLLPLDPKKTPRVRLTVLGEGEGGGFGDNDKVGDALKTALEAAGFTVALYDYASMERGEVFGSGVADMQAKFDVNILAANVATASNYTTRRLDWIPLMAANAPWFVKDIPTLLVSFASPYHMVDAPYISTFVNCYSNNHWCVQAAVDKLCGKSAFKGKSPVDVWCGGVWGADFM